VHSDGVRDPGRMLRDAADAGLDFLVSTEHNTNAANREPWPGGPGDPLVIAGEEVTTRHGHWLAIGLPDDGWVDWRYGPRDRVFARHADRVRAWGGLVVAAHPAVPVPSIGWEYGYRDVDAIEVWNGSWSLDDEASLYLWDRLLRRGRRVVAVGGSDAHSLAQRVGSPQTVVRAAELDTPALLGGLRRGRVYLAESAAVSLTVDADGAGPGDEAPVPVTVCAQVSGAPGTTLVLRTASGTVATAAVGPGGSQVLSGVIRDPAARYVRAEVRRRGGSLRGRMVALSNPVWLSPPTLPRPRRPVAA
jgi:hypothetical protein